MPQLFNILFRYLTLPKVGNLKLGAEDKLSYEFAVWLRQQYFNGKLQAVFFHVANEGAGKLAMVKKKAIGLLPGVADWVVTNEKCTIFIELKVKPNKQNENQKIFQQLCEKHNVAYYLCYTIEDAKNAVQKHFL